MPRRFDRYIEPLVDDVRFGFYREISNFSERVLAPRVLKLEREKSLVPDDLIAQMGQLGLFGLNIEERYGGQGGKLTDLVLMGLALAYHAHSMAITPGAAASLGSKPLSAFGNDAQKQAHLPDLAAGKRMFAFGLSEPGRGSDAANPETRAERDGDAWVITGEKCWTTNARWASHLIVHAMTNPEGRNGHRTTCFIVPMDAKGVDYNEMAGKSVWRMSSTGSVALDHVRVDNSTVLGEVDKGFKVMVDALNGGRLFIASLALASIGSALDKVADYAQERVQFGGKVIGRFQRVQDVVVDLDIAAEHYANVILDQSQRYDRGELPRESPAKAKIACSRTASHLLVDAMEICGGVACLDEFGLVRHHEDLFVTRVGEGSNRALKTQVAAALMPDIKRELQ
ncbi:MAG: acyl-CoA dehydrogenase family protein [Myxococcales bacterium]|nr:acyl-CoA dehydrogenase family protein [Myxococcales bacterium]